MSEQNNAYEPRPAVYAASAELALIKGCNGMRAWCENPAIYDADCRPPLSMVPLFDIDELWRASARAAEIESGKTKAAQAERDRLRDALIACLKEAFSDGYHSRSTYNDKDTSDADEEWEKQKAGIFRWCERQHGLSTIDAAAKGQG